MRNDHSIYVYCPHCKDYDCYSCEDGVETTYVDCHNCGVEFIINVIVNVTKLRLLFLRGWSRNNLC